MRHIAPRKSNPARMPPAPGTHANGNWSLQLMRHTASPSGGARRNKELGGRTVNDGQMACHDSFVS